MIPPTTTRIPGRTSGPDRHSSAFYDRSHRRACRDQRDPVRNMRDIMRDRDHVSNHVTILFTDSHLRWSKSQ